MRQSVGIAEIHGPTLDLHRAGERVGRIERKGDLHWVCGDPVVLRNKRQAAGA